MLEMTAKTFDIDYLKKVFGDRLKRNVPLARFTSARVGGNADAMISANSLDGLIEVTVALWRMGAPFLILGGGSNVLVSDAGVRQVVVYNRARRVRFSESVREGSPPTVWAESGANFGVIARQAAGHGLTGLEWAAGIPGTVGGAVVGNAGAHDGDVQGNLIMAEILHDTTQEDAEMFSYARETWPVDRLEFGYRTSALKKRSGVSPSAVVLAATFRLEHSTPEEVKAKIDRFVAYRRVTQPPGASMGSMFKNPQNDYAGRLIEAAGLKGARAGDAEISRLHANFFINHGEASAADVYQLIRKARRAVRERFGVELELEIGLIGEWEQT